MFRIILCLLVMICACVSQHRIVTDSSTTTLCWNSDVSDTAATYLFYYRNYSGTDTTWKYVGSTKETQYTVTKINKKFVIFGVQTLLYTDTSDMHSSLDSTACYSGEGCGPTCITLGSWYLNWKLKKPARINVKKIK